MVRKTEGAREKLGRLPERARARGKVNPPDQKLIRDGEDAASEPVKRDGWGGWGVTWWSSTMLCSSRMMSLCLSCAREGG